MLFRLIGNLIGLALVIALVTAGWIIIDGLNDQETPADCAVVLGNAVGADGTPGAIVRERLDKAVELYRAGKFPLVIVSGAAKDGRDEGASMDHYLITHGVPFNAIIEDDAGVNTNATAHDVAAIMQARGLHSCMIVSHYYHITRAKLALRHAGVTTLSQAHAGSLTFDDSYHIAREVVGLYAYLGEWYLRPAAEKAAAQASVDAQKAKVTLQDDAQKLRQDAQQERDKLAPPAKP
jgi:vancomycin permeability regulator SanA